MWLQKLKIKKFNWILWKLYGWIDCIFYLIILTFIFNIFIDIKISEKQILALKTVFLEGRFLISHKILIHYPRIKNYRRPIFNTKN